MTNLCNRQGTPKITKDNSVPIIAKPGHLLRNESKGLYGLSWSFVLQEAARFKQTKRYNNSGQVPNLDWFILVLAREDRCVHQEELLKMVNEVSACLRSLYANFSGKFSGQDDYPFKLEISDVHC